MAHLTSAAVWTVDTSSATKVSSTPVFIDYIIVTWKVASAGTLLIQEQVPEGATATTKNPILDAISLGASSAAVDQMTQQFHFKRLFQNVWLTTANNIASCYIYTR